MERRDLTFRVFVSSTFSDLKAERDALQRDVFPRLREYCRKHGARFQAIDLRWGISEEAAADQSTMRICRAEIARCQAVTPRPNFVVLLGDRHGWRPLPDEIPAAEFEALLPHLPAELAKRWYKLDENAVCPRPDGTGPDKGVYALQSRAGAGNWAEEVEDPLGDAFRRAARAVGSPEAVRRKYEASATHQEINEGAFDTPGAQEHAIAFIRELRTADGRPLREALPHDAALREFVDLKHGALDRESQDQLDALKRKLRDRFGPKRVRTYSARWKGNGASTAHVAQLCADVYRALRRLIHAQIQRHRAMPPLDEERLRHQDFARRRARDFTGQSEPLAAIERYLSPAGEATVPLVVHGVSGSGKSALLARVVERQESEAGSQKPDMVVRFIGATASSTDPRSLLEGMCRELGERYGADDTDLAADLNKLTIVFRQRLALATAESPLTLVLDALDQLQCAGRPELSWLPDRLPPHVRLVVSVAEAGSPQPADSGQRNDCLTLLRGRWPAANFLPLQPMRPEDATELFQKWLARANHRLASAAQREVIRDAIGRCSLPLYLRLAFEEAQRWRSYDPPQSLSSDVDGLIKRMFRQLSEQLHHDETLVERAVGFLRCSRYGLTEDEMLDLLASDDEYWSRFLESAHHALPVTDGPQARRLPIVIWSRLYHDLEPYLSWRSADGTALMVFFHTRFNEVADRQFLGVDTVRLTRHQQMADYFHAQDFFLESLKEQQARVKRIPPTPRTSNLRKAAELPWQRLRCAQLSGQWDELEELFTTLLFLEGKAEADMVFGLVGDFAMAVASLPHDRVQHQTLRLLEEAIRRDIQFLARHPTTLFQCLWNSCWWYDCPTAGQYYENRQAPSPSTGHALSALLERWLAQKQQATRGFRWLRSQRPPPTHLGTAQTAVLRGHEGKVMSVCISPDGQQIASGGGWLDKTLRVWDADSGAELVSMHGYRVEVRSVGYSPDGRQIASGWDDGKIRLCDARTGIELRSLSGHERTVSGVSYSPRGEHIASASWDKTVRVWDSKTDATLAVLRGHSCEVSSVCFTPDGRRIVSGSWDKTARIWDSQSGGVLAVLRGHRKDVTSVCCSPDGQRIASGSSDGTVRIWNAAGGAELAVLYGHSNEVTSVCFSPDGRHIVSGSWDKTLRIWDANSGADVAHLCGHDEIVTSVCYSPDGRRIISGSEDRTVRVWNAGSSSELALLVEHDTALTGIIYSPDGRRLLSVALLGANARVWDAIRGVELAILRGDEDDYMTSARFSSDGRHIVSEYDNGCVRTWDVDTGKGTRVAFRKHEVAVCANVRMQEFCRALTSGLDTIVELVQTRQPVAWFAVPLNHITVHPSGRSWAGAISNHLYIISLEGDCP